MLIFFQAVSSGTPDKPWCEKIVARDALAVHKKKIQEVEDWMMKAVSGVKVTIALNSYFGMYSYDYRN